MTRQGDFLIYCVETYKNAKHLTGKQVAELFTRYRVWDYVYSCFEALHTTGANYIVEEAGYGIKPPQAVPLHTAAPSHKGNIGRCGESFAAPFPPSFPRKKVVFPLKMRYNLR